MTACGGVSTDAADAPITEVRDSSGIRIVENRLPNGIAPVYAELGDVELEIGVVEGEAAYQFTRVEAVRSLDADRILVADGDALELRVFDAAGAHSTTFGREGNGPGEFARFNDVGVIGDTIWVFDSWQRQVALFQSDGTFLDAERVGADQMPRIVEEHMWLFPDGSWLNLREIPAVGFGLLRSEAALIRLPPELGPMDTVAVTPWRESFAFRNSRGGIIAGGLPFGRSAAIAVDPALTVMGWNASYRLEYRDRDGALQMVVLASDLEVPLGPAEVDRERRDGTASCTPPWCADLAELLYSEEAIPEVRPAFSDLLIDTPGYVWVAPYRPPEDEPVTWHVFSPEGELMGRVSIPDGLTVHAIGEDYLLGVVTDDFDVPYVRRYGLTRLR